MRESFSFRVWSLSGAAWVCGALVAAGQNPQPVVAIHDSELTRALEAMPAANGTPTGPNTTGFQWWVTNWHYFFMPDSVKEALRSDGTQFAVVGDSNIISGQLVDDSGQPAYPILVSLSSEAVDNREIAQLTNYVAAGGTLLVGGSAFTRATNGASRGDFAIANAMGIHMVNTNVSDWTVDVTFAKQINAPLVAHIPGGVLDWNMPVSADETCWGVSPTYLITQGHLIWEVQAGGATVVAQGDATPYLLTNSYGKGTIIYIAALEPFLAHGGNGSGMYAYGILRNAIEGAFANANLPVPKVSPWPFQYAAALEVRHDLENLQGQISSIPESAQFEFTNGAKGDYYFCTGTLRVEMTNSPVVIGGLQSAVTNYGATISPHNGGVPNINNFSLVLSNYDYWHWGTDEAMDAPAANVPNGYGSTTNYAFLSTSNSFLDMEGWLAGITNGLRLTVAPHFNATREASYQIEQALGINASGEQKLGIFPSWVLSASTNTPDMRYPFISIPTSEWYINPPVVAQAMEDNFEIGTLRQLVDFYYNWGGLVNLYSHSSSAGDGMAGVLASDYVTYGMSKPRIWPANAASIYTWWLARSNAQVSAVYTSPGNQSVVTFNISGATDPRTAVELVLPRSSVSGLQVMTNNVPAGTNCYWTNGSLIKVLVGTNIASAQVTYLLNPQVQSNYYTATESARLNVSSPGVLAGVLRGATGNNPTARVSTGPSFGTVTVTNNGGFTYKPATNFTGIDSFTYSAHDSAGTSLVARATIDVAPPGDLFYDNFLRSTNADPLAPWTPVQGTWTINGGLLQGTDPDAGTYDDAYVPGNWTNYSVAGQFQVSAGGIGGGLTGQVNPVSGAKYAVIIYPNGIPGVTAAPIARLEKFLSWQVLTPSTMEQVNLPQIGTNWHTLQLMFRTNQILAYLDGSLIINTNDNNFGGVPAYTSGGIGAHFFTYQDAYLMSFDNVLVTTAPIAANGAYSTVENQALGIDAPGLLADDTPGAGSNLTAVLASGPTNGTVNLSANGAFVYTPATNYVGPDSFSYQVSDGVGTSAPAVVSIIVESNSPPVANNDSYYFMPNTTLRVAAPGVLANDTSPEPNSLTALLVSAPSYGALTLNADGGFSYVPGANFNGIDTFSYMDFDGYATSGVATVTLTDPAFGALFYDNFSRATNPGPLAPWISEAEPGTVWTVAGGALVGGPNTSSTYGNAYLTNIWTDYAVQGQFQFGPNAYGGGLGGRVNPATGAHYAAWIYPSAAPNNLNLIKFQDWQTVGAFMASVNLPAIGTNWHTLKLAFRGNEIAVYYDGTMITNVMDTSSPYLSGGVSVDMYTVSSYQLSVSNVLVDPLVMPGSYFMAENTTLLVAPSGLLANDTGVYGTNLAAVPGSGPANGVLNLNSNGGFSYTPAANFTGEDSFTYQADDPGTNLGIATVTIAVGPPHNGPSLPAQPNLVIDELTAMVVTNTATETNIPPLALGYALIDPPYGASIDTNGIITWMPSPAQAPSTNVFTTVVGDSGTPSQSATNSFTVVVIDLNIAPVLPAQTNLTISGLATLTVTNTAAEADFNASLTYTLINAPSNAVISANGIITWTPVVAQVPSTNRFTTAVTDYDPQAANATSLSATNSFAVVDLAIHNGPTLPQLPVQTVIEPSTLIVTNTAGNTDVPPTTLTYTLVSPPAGAGIDANGIITWTPSATQGPSNYVITTIVSDNGTPSLSATNSFVAVVGVLPVGDMFYDNFTRTNPADLSPWVVESGAWAITASVLQGGTNEPDSYGTIYLPNSWTDYAVVASVQFGTNAYGVGLEGRLDPATGERYGLWIYPATTNLHIVKFTEWETPEFLTTVHLPSEIGTGVHTLKLAFIGNQIAGYYDGVPETTVTDTASPYLSGGVALDVFTPTSGFLMSVFSVEVDPLAMSGNYSVTENNTLIVPAPGLLGNATGVYGTNLTAVLAVPPVNGSVNLGTNGAFTYTPNENFVGADRFSYQANDSQTNLGTAIVNITVNLHPPPVLPPQGTVTMDEMTTLEVTNTASDASVPTPALTYTLVSAPAGAAIDTNGIITWTPTQAQSPSTNVITAVVSDNASPSLSATNSFTVVVNDANSAPVLPAQPDLTIVGLESIAVTNTATDADIHVVGLTYALLTAPANAAIDANGVITWTPVLAQVPSTNVFTTVATDYDPLAVNATNLSATNSFTVVVQAFHNPPVLPTQTNVTINELQTLNVTNTAGQSDIPPLALFYALVNSPTNASIDANGVITWTPTQAQAPSTNVITTVVTDSGTPSLSTTNSFTVVVNDLNSAPVLPVQTNLTIVGLTPLVVTNTATDSDIHVVGMTYALLVAPTNAAIDGDGMITWTPVVAQVPSTNVFTTVVTDYDPQAVNATNLSATNSFTVIVEAVHNPPVLPIQTNVTINELQTLDVTNTAGQSDIPPLALFYALVNSPTNASIDANGIITWTPTQAQAPSTNVITTVVTDGGTPSFSATNSFTAVVNDLNSAPVLPVQTNVTIVGLTPLVVTNTATDSDIHVVSMTYALLNAPTNAAIDSNGVITWTPLVAQVPSTNVFTTVATDYDPQAVNAINLNATNSFTVVVQAVHNPPVLPIQTNATINESTTLDVTNTASQSNIPPLSLFYTLVNSPTNASIDANGVITWTPTQAQAPSTNVVATVVTDNGTPSLSATNSFTVVVNDLNSPPILPVQTNLTIVGLTPLVVTNTATDSDIHVVSMTYALLVAPTNAAIDGNGVITWTPVVAQVPSTNVITTVATDYDPQAANATNLSATNSFTVVAQAVHNPPVLPLQTNVTINELAGLDVTNTATESSIPPLTLFYALVNSPTNASIDANGVITWTPTQAQAPSTNGVTTVVTDSGTPSLSATNSFTVVVNDLNSVPVLPVQTNLTIVGLTPLVVTNTATDSDIHVVSMTYALLDAPTNAVIDGNGVITWTPIVAQVPSTNVFTTVATDYDPLAVNATNLSATNSFTVVVQAVHNAPVLPAQTNLTIDELTELDVTNTASQSDIPPLALFYALVNSPTNASIDANGVITWTPTQAQAPSTNVITTVVTDSGTPSLSTTNSFTVVVNDLNSAPVLPVQTNLTIVGLTPLVVTNTATDSDIHVVGMTYALLVAPTNAAIDGNGMITWTPVVAQVPSTNVFTTVVTDYDPQAVNATSLSATNSFTVIVEAVHNPPVLPIQTNVTINELQTLDVTNTATESSIPPLALSYSLVNSPANASIDTNGIISWTPAQAQAPSTNVITTVVSDSGTPSLSATNSFTVVVTATNAQFKITSILVSDGTARITWNSVAGQTYTLQTKTNLTDTNWQDTLPSVTASQSTAAATNVLGAASLMFYRVRLGQAAIPPPVVQSVRLTNGTATVAWSSVANGIYRLQFKNMLPDGNWNDVLPNVTATGPTATMTNAVNGASQRFYRVLLLP